ncbi:helix-turn-helix transcriptional regulator [Amorphus orientalis]|uniref:Shikimate kinase n=1 Tax=Amorphus orientalis TaxID=649198 RepID=A0AAE3VQR4_9HYPH|nr:helix-turn-helix transcriptional regulator [Amorphus orientalis]MDQ0316460.1 XRE family aerobic/anaerobic benzoate catabolism transcriptional regulator [Amorphus orientalis]
MSSGSVSEIVTFSGRVSSTDEASLAEGSSFLEMVGERVRNGRARRGMSRKALSEASGVSQRYLAQLESGSGNISIALLRRIADALDFRIEWLVGEDDPFVSEIPAVAALYRVATREQRRRVLEILDPEHPDLRRASRVALIGLRGAGKSTIGRLTASAVGVPFLELNEEIEQASGMPVNEVMALYGQEGYRRLERQSVERVAATHDAIVLAVAGGIVSEPETFNYLLRHFHTIWLKAQPEEHMTRVRAQGDERPMAGNAAAMDELKSILTSREALYARAEAVVDTSGRTIEETLGEVLDTIKTKSFLDGGAADGARYAALWERV